MALTRITKGVIKPNENYDTHNINSTGIVTAIGLDVNGNGDISGNLNVGGVLTYEDVTSIDSVGLITARDGIFLPDNKKLEFGNQAGSSDFRIYHDGTRNVLAGFTGSDINIESYFGADVNIITNSNHYAIKCISNAQVELYHDNVKRLETSATGVSIPQDLDVDGHTNLDNVSIAGITTTTETIRIQGNNKYLTVGASNQIGVVHTGGEAYITNSSGHFTHRSDVHKWENYAGSAQYLRIDSSGNVIVNNTTAAAGSYTYKLLASDNISSTEQTFGIQYPGVVTYGLNAESNSDFTIKKDGAERLRIDSDGRLLIGINASGQADANLQVFRPTGTTSRLQVGNVATSASGVAGIDFCPSNKVMGSRIECQAQEDFSTSANRTAELVFFTRHNGTSSEKVRITSGGSVGIGLTNPEVQYFNNLVVGNNVAGDKGITIRSNSGNSGILAFSDTDAADANRYDGYIRYSHADQHMSFYTALGNKRFTINEYGYVGVNTTQHSINGMSRYLSVSARNITNGGSAIEIVGNRTGSDQTLGVINFVNDASNVAQITAKYQGSTTSGSLQFFTSGSEKLRIKSDGNVVIKNHLAVDKTGFETLTGNGVNAKLQVNVGSNDYDGILLGGGYNRSTITTGGNYDLVYTSNAYPANATSYGHRFLCGSDGGGGPHERLRITSGGNLKLPDNAKIELGGAQTGAGDLEIYYDGTDGFINQKNNALKIQHNGTLKSYFGSNTLNLQDNYKLGLGTANALQIYHSGSHSYIDEVGTGNLYIRNGTKNSIWCQTGGQVNLYYNDAVRLFTSDAGATIRGEIATAQDYPDIRPALDFNFASQKKLDSRLTYTRSGPASFINESGKLVRVGDDVPRFDHDQITRECRGLLIEETRTNNFKGTGNMGSSGSWEIGGDRGSQGANVEGPDGTLTALQNIYNGSTGDLNIHLKGGEISTSNSTAYTFSVFVKMKPGNNYITAIRMRTYNSNRSATFYINSGSLGSINEGSANVTSRSIIEYPNGWYRCIMTFLSGTDGNQGFQIYLSNAENASLNSSGASGEAMYFWGAQLEQGSFATSFIPTTSQNTATRGQDSLVMTGTDVDDIFNPDEGTMFYEASVTDLTNANQPIVAFRNSLNTGEEFFAMGHATGGSPGYVRVWSKNSAGTNVHLTTHGTALVADTPYKHAFGYAYNNYSDVFTQGTTSSQLNTTSGNHAMMATGVIDELRFGAYYTNLTTYSLESGHIKRFSYWPQRITNSQLKTYIS